MAQQIARYFNPVLTALKKLGGSARPSEVCSMVAQDMKLKDTVLEETLESGQSRFENKVAFVRLYLVLTGYIDRSRRGVWTLTDKGRNAGRLSDAEIQSLLLEIQRKGKHSGDESDAVSTTPIVGRDGLDDEEEAPEEILYTSQLLTILRSLPAPGFERLCQRLLRESGFEQVTVTGRSGDGGIDGIGTLKINPFVTFKVLFQCKRYSGTVGASQVRDFRGAMQGRADKGIILTTGLFSADAHKEAVRDGVPPIELVDGDQLIGLFEQMELGLTPRTTYDVNIAFFESYRS
jgi:restriction system protein